MNLQEIADALLVQHAAFAQEQGKQEPAWLTQRRNKALTRFETLGFPTTRHEEWKYTNLAKTLQHRYLLPSSHVPDGGWTPESLTERLDLSLEGPRLVFVDGTLSTKLSNTDGLPASLVFGSLQSALQTHAGLVEDHFARLTGECDRAFVALNDAFWSDGAFLSVPRGVVCTLPLSLVFVRAKGADTTAVFPRTLVVAGPNSQCEVVEFHLGENEAPGMVCAVSEVVLGDGAIVQHDRVQFGGVSEAWITDTSTHQGSNSTYSARTYTLRGALSRNDTTSVLAAPGSTCNLDGLYLADGKRHIDSRTVIDHAAPHCQSNQLYKSVLLDRGRGVFQGKVVVRQDAQQTNAFQSNPNLLLSEGAVADTRPQLEIYADDVRCTHGATVGQLDQAALFYLRSRGMSLEQARQLLTWGFASELFERTSTPELGRWLRRQARAILEGPFGGSLEADDFDELGDEAQK